MKKFKNSRFSKIMSFAIILSLAFFSVACSTKMRVNTDPNGADVYVDGEHQGKSPVTYDAKSGPPSSGDINVVAKKEGYKDAEKNVERSEMNTTNFVVGLILLGVPALLWSWEYPSSINLMLQPEQTPDKSESKVIEKNGDLG